MKTSFGRRIFSTVFAFLFLCSQPVLSASADISNATLMNASSTPINTTVKSNIASASAAGAMLFVKSNTVSTTAQIGQKTGSYSLGEGDSVFRFNASMDLAEGTLMMLNADNTLKADTNITLDEACKKVADLDPLAKIYAFNMQNSSNLVGDSVVGPVGNMGNVTIGTFDATNDKNENATFVNVAPEDVTDLPDNDLSGEKSFSILERNADIFNVSGVSTTYDIDGEIYYINGDFSIKLLPGSYSISYNNTIKQWFTVSQEQYDAGSFSILSPEFSKTFSVGDEVPANTVIVSYKGKDGTIYTHGLLSNYPIEFPNGRPKDIVLFFAGPDGKLVKGDIDLMNAATCDECKTRTTVLDMKQNHYYCAYTSGPEGQHRVCRDLTHACKHCGAIFTCGADAKEHARCAGCGLYVCAQNYGSADNHILLNCGLHRMCQVKDGNYDAHSKKIPCGHYQCQEMDGEDHTLCTCGIYRCSPDHVWGSDCRDDIHTPDFPPDVAQ